MLGIWRYQGVAIDLWVGEADSFVSDLSVIAPKSEQSYIECFKKSEELNIRHLTILYSLSEALGKNWHTEARADQDALMAFSVIKKSVDTGALGISTKRITFVLDNIEVHTSFKSGLYTMM